MGAKKKEFLSRVVPLFIGGLICAPFLEVFFFFIDFVRIDDLFSSFFNRNFDAADTSLDYGFLDMFKFGMIGGGIGLIGFFWEIYINNPKKYKESSNEDDEIKESSNEDDEINEVATKTQDSSYSPISHTLIGLVAICSIFEIILAPAGETPKVMSVIITWFISRFIMKQIYNSNPFFNYKIIITIAVWLVVMFVQGFIVQYLLNI